MRLSDDDLRAVLARAEEIQRATHEGADLATELEAVIGAGEAVGLARPAVERALREHLDLAPALPRVGDLAFARSSDDNFYVAEVLGISTDGVRVRFLRGSEHVASQDQVRPAPFLPGERVMCHWPWWGPWQCTILSYDAAKRRVKVSDGWGYTRWFPIAEVWLAPRRPAGAGRSRARIYTTLLGTGALLGAIAGALLTAWLAR